MSDVLPTMRAVDLDAVVRSFPAGSVIVFDHDLRYLKAGGLGLVDVGLTRTMLEGNTIFEAFPPEVASAIEPSYRRALAGYESSADVAFQGRVYLQRLGPVRDVDGVIVAGIGSNLDVTQARQSERTLRESEMRFRLAFEDSPVPMSVITVDGRYERVNHAMCTFSGYSADQFRTLGIADLTHPDDLATDTVAMAGLLAGDGMTYAVDKRYITADGATVWARKSATLLRRADGKPVHFVVQIQDITERKRHEQEMAEERRRSAEAEAIGRVGFWEMDMETTTLTWSAGLHRVWGTDAAALNRDFGAASPAVHPDDLGVIQTAIADCRSNGEPFSVRFRINRISDGVRRWVNVQGAARWENGRIVRIGGAVADITEQVRAELDAVRAAAFQQAVFKASPDVIAVWDLDTWSILWTNRSIAEQLGYSPEEEAAFGTDLVGNLVFGDDRVRLLASIDASRIAPDDSVTEVDFRMLHKDGTDRWFSRRSAPLRRNEQGLVTQIVAVSRDTTAAKLIEEALRESEAMFRQLTDSVDVAFVLRSWHPAEILYVSPGFEKIFGYDPIKTQESPEGTVGRTHPEDIERFMREYWAPATAGRSARLEYRIVRPDGGVRWVRSSVAPVRGSGGRPDRSATVIEDITVSRRADGAWRAAEAAEKASAAKNEFLSRMSHELRTPLNAVLGFAQLLELDDLTAVQNVAVRHIIRGGRHLVGLIDDVLDISKIEGDRLEMSMELVPVSQLLRDTVDLMTPQAAATAITLHYLPDADVHRAVLADHRRLRQVVINLLSNAIKYNHPGGRVDIECTSGDSHLDITVLDTGRGIHPDLLPRLFTPFDRLDAQSTGIEGTGVGLALSHRLMSLMNGTLTATSELGSGSAFTVSIPWATGPRTDIAVAESARTDDHAGQFGEPGKTLLYIEDNSSNIEFMTQLLTRRPHWTMTVAGQGALGLELAAAAPPDLVLLDLHLPDMNGIDILRHLNADPSAEQLTVVVVSADANPHQIDRLLTAGAYAYLTKPLDVADMLRLLDTRAAEIDDRQRSGSGEKADSSGERN